jgi:transcriptional regulator of nitric oxide reductase
MDNILVPVSPAEVLDKITILEIKSERMTDPAKLDNVRVELELLRQTWSKSVPDDPAVQRLHTRLKEVNEALWQIEDDIRDKERLRQFDEHFIELARSVYMTNDHRSQIKKELNLLLGSRLLEEKSYQAY